MAKQQEQESISGVLNTTDGWQYVTAKQSDLMDALLNTYSARIMGFKVRDGEKATNITMKIVFPECDDENNAWLWSMFIGKAAFILPEKPTISVQREGEGYAGYVSWPIWKNVTFRESSRKGQTNGF